jgi:UDP-2,3-diacylglucosamine hydrolase
VAGALRRAAGSGIEVRLMTGNRDFLLGERFARESGARLLDDPCMAGFDGVPTLLMHGDTLCTDDRDYQAWRATARSGAWQRDFLARPLRERRAIAAGLRERSQAVIQEKPALIMDVNGGAVEAALRAHGAARLVHGHTHRPGRHVHHVEGRARERWVLPDWYGTGGLLRLVDGTAELVFL